MRIDTPGDNWVELRSAGELTGADDDAWHAVFYEIRLAAEEDDDDGMEVSADGVSMVPKKQRVKVPPDFLQRQRDALLASLITDWSYKDAPFSLELPYSAESRKVLPLAACKALDEAIKPHKEALNGSGPKETTGPGSENGSGDESQPPAGLGPRTARYCVMLARYGLKPWEYDALPLDVRRWLDPVAGTIRDIEAGN